MLLFQNNYFCIVIDFWDMSFRQFLIILLLATVKTLVSPPVAYAMGMTFWWAFLAIALGGVLGFAVTFYLTDWIVKLRLKRKTKSNLRKARKIVALKRKYKSGVFLFILPFFSVPVMAYIVRKFFGRARKTVFASCFIVVFWCLIFCLIYSPIQRL